MVPKHSRPRTGRAPKTSAWIPMPLLSAEQKASGITLGGEGGQWPRDLAISRADPNFLLLAIDVGGLYRSLDGGRSWRQSLAGWDARGCNHLAIDLNNPDIVLGVAGNSMEFGENWNGGRSPHGVYISRDRAASWTHTLMVRDGIGGRVAFDPSRADGAPRRSLRAYFLSVNDGLFRSDDGGERWTRISRPLPEPDPDSYLRIASDGRIFLGGKSGLVVSDNAGATFARLRETPVGGLDLASDDTVFVSDSAGVWRSSDGGKTFSRLPGAGLETQGKVVQNVRISPADPARLACWVQGDNWKWVRYASADGGLTWKSATVEKRLSVLPNNVRNGFVAWHPTRPNVVFGLGGDIVTRSDDGGVTFVWSASGYNGIMLGGLMNLSGHAPGAAFLAFQDYNAALTRDGGKTWAYLDASGKGWGGFCYGGYTPDGVTLFYGDAESWGGPRRLRVSRDSGKSWSFAKGMDGKELVFAGPDVSVSDPADQRILFASNFRSTDSGATWLAMDGCDGVFTASPNTHALIGKKGRRIVRSTDHGATWTTVADAPADFRDLAVDGVRGRYYAAAGDRLLAFERGAWTTIETPLDQYGNRSIKTVAVDPRRPERVFVGGSADIYATAATVCASIDAGKTWSNLTAGDGPHEVCALRVHPTTGDLWANGQCYGMWRYPSSAPLPTSGPTRAAIIPPSAR